ncbi:hypothetical protein T01_13070 [Trichinella spiralis]|uniref:Uncharacterized protein n=1 Tax=Trichinella spiralis TaxID=6334 RepID=A0A0V1B9D8_TRISP|nr:hypothetical protein T01_13070 [Trichinella spiralis]
MGEKRMIGESISSTAAAAAAVAVAVTALVSISFIAETAAPAERKKKFIARQDKHKLTDKR